MTTPQIHRIAEWTQTPPTEQGTYWHWNGNEDCAPLPTFVLWSGTTGKCFVSRGQLGIEDAIDCDHYGGWWMPLHSPALPPVTPDQPHAPAVVPEARPAAPAQGETPRTDAVMFTGKDVPYMEVVAIARQLERELNAAKDSYAQTLLDSIKLEGVISALRQQLAQVTRERDEANENKDDWMARHYGSQIDLAQVTRERDEARARVENLRESYQKWATKWDAAESELAELRKDRDRLQRFAQIVWDARWGSGENDQHTEKLNNMVGIAAEIRSGNFQSIDAARQQREGA